MELGDDRPLLLDRLALSLLGVVALRRRGGAERDVFRVDPAFFKSAGLEGLHRLGELADRVASPERRNLDRSPPPSRASASPE